MSHLIIHFTIDSTDQKFGTFFFLIYSLICKECGSGLTELRDPDYLQKA